MRFRIYRTSESQIQPCPEAFLAEYTYVCKCSFASVDEMSDWTRHHWFVSGRNHRAEGGKLLKDLTVEAWFVEIGSLEELVVLHQQLNERLILKTDASGLLALEIYDDYH